MPVKSSTSPVLKWPDRRQVEEEVRAWASRQVEVRPGLVKLGFFGSYARDDAGVGSDLDLIAIVESVSEPFERRSVSWDLTSLPVPAEILVYSSAEWSALRDQGGGRFGRVLREETVWVHS